MSQEQKNLLEAIKRAEKVAAAAEFFSAAATDFNGFCGGTSGGGLDLAYYVSSAIRRLAEAAHSNALMVVGVLKNEAKK